MAYSIFFSVYFVAVCFCLLSMNCCHLNVNSSSSSSSTLVSDDVIESAFANSVNSGLISLRMIRLYREQHGRDAIFRGRSSDTNTKVSNSATSSGGGSSTSRGGSDICERKFIIGTYSCPMQVGNRIHEFLNAFAAAVILGRTLVYKFCDRSYCRTQSRAACDKMLTVLNWIPSLQETNEFAIKMNCPLYEDASNISTTTPEFFETLPNFVIPSKRREYSLYILQCCKLGKIEHRAIQLGVLERHEVASLTWKSGKVGQKGSSTFDESSIRLRADVLFNHMLSGEHLIYGMLFYNAFQFEDSILQRYTDKFESSQELSHDHHSSLFKTIVRDFSLAKLSSMTMTSNVSQFPEIKLYADKLIENQQNKWNKQPVTPSKDKKKASSAAKAANIVSHMGNKDMSERDPMTSEESIRNFISIWNSLFNFIEQFLYKDEYLKSNPRGLRVGIHIRHPYKDDTGDGSTSSEETCILEKLSNVFAASLNNINKKSISPTANFSCEVIIASDREHSVNNLIENFCNVKLMALTNSLKLSSCVCISGSYQQNHFSYQNSLPQVSSSSKSSASFLKLNVGLSSPNSEHGIYGDSIYSMFDLFLLSHSDIFFGGSDNNGMLSTYGMLAASLSRYRKYHIIHQLVEIYLAHIYKSLVIAKPSSRVDLEVLMNYLDSRNKQIVQSRTTNVDPNSKPKPYNNNNNNKNNTMNINDSDRIIDRESEDTKLFWLPNCGRSRGGYSTITHHHSLPHSTSGRSTSANEASKANYMSSISYPEQFHSIEQKAAYHHALYKLFEKGNAPFECSDSHNINAQMPKFC